ncbi:MAG TPA: hypothetical protein VIS96_16635 [Terrimicrobiaceae bacterium]
MKLIEIEPNHFINADHIVELLYEPAIPDHEFKEMIRVRDEMMRGEANVKPELPNPERRLSITLAEGCKIILTGVVADLACEKLEINPVGKSGKPSIDVERLASPKSQQTQEKGTLLP